MVTEVEIRAAMRDLRDVAEAARTIVAMIEAERESRRRADLRCLRQERGITQMELSRLTGVCATEISFFERGKRPLSVRNAKRLAEFFGIRWTAFFEQKEVERETVRN